MKHSVYSYKVLLLINYARAGWISFFYMFCEKKKYCEIYSFKTLKYHANMLKNLNMF